MSGHCWAMSAYGVSWTKSSLLILFGFYFFRQSSNLLSLPSILSCQSTTLQLKFDFIFEKKNKTDGLERSEQGEAAAPNSITLIKNLRCCLLRAINTQFNRFITHLQVRWSQNIWASSKTHLSSWHFGCDPAGKCKKQLIPDMFGYNHLGTQWQSQTFPVRHQI